MRTRKLLKIQAMETTETTKWSGDMCESISIWFYSDEQRLLPLEESNGNEAPKIRVLDNPNPRRALSLEYAAQPSEELEMVAIGHFVASGRISDLNGDATMLVYESVPPTDQRRVCPGSFQL